MLVPELATNENIRIKTLQGLDVLDTPPEERLDRITQVAANMFNVPMALVSLVDENRQWFKSCVGLDATETARDISFCGHAILQDDVFIVEDASIDARFSDNPLVQGEPHIRFYAGCPLIHENGTRVGTLCIIDKTPRSFTEYDAELLKELAVLVELELVQHQSDTIDYESGLSNKQGFLTLSSISLKICQKLNLSISVAFLYVKGLMSFKSDHQDYLTILSIIGEAFKLHLRGSDIIARYDETGFVALLTNANKQTTQQVLSKLVEEVNEKLSEVGITHHCEMVTGITSGEPEQDIETLIFEAFIKLHEGGL